jgi:TRAP-type C4-dicarboxylate transport system permease small subunit
MSTGSKTSGKQKMLKRVLHLLGRLYDFLVTATMYIGACLILFMVIVISASVFLRKTRYSFVWGIEASEYILIVCTFLATGWLLRSGGHINVDVVPNFLKGRSQELYNGFLFSVVAAVSLWLTVVGIEEAWGNYVSDTLQVKVYTFPKWILSSLVPLGAIFLFVESMKLAYRHFRGKLVLLVDDEIDILDTLAELLKDYRIRKASSFGTAADLLKSTVYDAVILDIMGVQGFELLKISAEKGLPTIMLTSHALNLDAFRRTMRSGAISFLPKEKMSDIGSYINDAITLSKEDARANFYRRMGSYFDHRFGAGWSTPDAFWTEAEGIIVSEEKG